LIVFICLGSNFTLSTLLSSSSVHLSYYHKQQENLQFGVEMETNFRLQESLAAIGYQIDIPKANAVFRAQVDSSFTVGAVLEKKLFPLPFTLALSGMINHSKNVSRFGIGLIIG
ncbi:unnamed protein product, partial [Soboliphyme baturini]|uniref:Mitochondrial import receptor subunit TOM40 homolog n=1 Tax=Soboliphyme baturini TaxID=241478 RepID=A0A183J353_9BILA